MDQRTLATDPHAEIREEVAQALRPLPRRILAPGWTATAPTRPNSSRR